MSYMYMYKWIRVLSFKGDRLKNYKPSVNLTYIYGKDKAFLFHTDKWINLL